MSTVAICTGFDTEQNALRRRRKATRGAFSYSIGTPRAHPDVVCPAMRKEAALPPLTRHALEMNSAAAQLVAKSYKLQAGFCVVRGLILILHNFRSY